jgi:S-adenosylmethionine:tRNA ribosyltransferase-isomerase
MKTSDFFFELPECLVAQYPGGQRGKSRLMTLDRVTGARRHETVSRLPEILCERNFLSPSGEKPLLIFNDTKVRKARIAGRSARTGAETEFLLLEKMNDKGTLWKALSKRAKRKKPGSVYIFCGGEVTDAAEQQAVEPAVRAVVAGVEGEFVFLEFDRAVDDEWLEKHGHIPLPPYIKRKDAPEDAVRYQTVYAKQTGSSAAPTAGLHFTREILDALALYGVESVFITLHVGLGTFLPVHSARVEDHVMHEEQFIITDENAALIENARGRGRKIIAVGTTSLRALESAACCGVLKNGTLARGVQSTSIFIYPPYKFKMADALFTNFHTPHSTLLMLVSAFADGAFDGRSLILESYAEAVREEYRFFSYGDAMLIY